MGQTLKWSNYSRTAGAITAVGLGVYIATLQPPDGLTVQAMRILGTIVWAVIFWILNVLPEYVVGLLMCVLWVTTKAVTFNQAFANFATDSFWIMVGAFGIGVAATKCGLLKRLALIVINLFPSNFSGQVLGLLGAGLLTAPLIPSITAKGVIAAPIALNISDTLGYPRKSSGAAGIFGAMYIGFCSTGPLFFSSSFVCFMLYGLLPQQVQAQFSWWYWLIASLPWGIFMIAASALVIHQLYRPATTTHLRISDQMASMGSMTRDEKITLAILLITIILWITERIHGISAGVVAVTGMCALLSFNIFDREDFRTKVDWTAVLFIGSVNNMGDVIQTLNIDKWIGKTLEHSITAYMSHPYIFIVLLAGAVILSRFLIVSIAATAVVFTLVLIPLSSAHGINPWIITMVVFASTNVWFAFYENSTYLSVFYATGGEMVEHGQMVKLSTAYAVISTVGLLLSIPYWKLLGLIQ